jgi:vancomycin resistance protein YoaR
LAGGRNSRYSFDEFSTSKPRAGRRAQPRHASAPKHAQKRRSYNTQRNTAAVRAPKRHRTAFTFLIILLVAGLVITAGVVGFNMYREYRKGLPFTYSDGVNVSGIDIGQLSVKEARAKLKENAMSVVKDININVKAKDIEKTYTKESFKYEFDFETPLKEAKIYSLKDQGVYETKKGETAAETDGSTDSPEFTLNYKLVKDSVKKQIKKLAKKIDIAAKNAKVVKFHPFADKRFEYKEGSGGVKLDQKALNKKFAKFFNSGKSELNVNAKVDKIKPKITVKDIKREIVGLATASSVSTNTPEGTNNMKVALKACNGSVIEPGATWSFNKCTGDSNLESNGYKKAAVISEKKVKQGVGGGICQASTIIFEAGLFSNMEIVERHNHYWASAYAYAGEDATIDYPDLDLRMRNKTDYQMFIECRLEDGNRLRVNIWGYQDPDYDNIRLHSENYRISKNDFHTRTFRELFKNGEIIKTETICDSYYNIKHSVKTPDAETYRTTVNGYNQSEDAEYETMEVIDTREKNSEKETENDEEDSENNEDNNDDSSQDSEENNDSEESSE